MSAKDYCLVLRPEFSVDGEFLSTRIWGIGTAIVSGVQK
jgi:hypothetical protein